MNDIKNQNEDIRTKLNRETGKISWALLTGSQNLDDILVVASELDLIDVAVDFAMDNTSSVNTLLKQQLIRKADGELVKGWSADLEVWAVVVAPWILVQEITQEEGVS